MTEHNDKELLEDINKIHDSVGMLHFKYYTGEMKLNPAINKRAFERYLKKLTDESRKLKANVIVGLVKQFENEGALPVDEVPFTANIYQTEVIPPNDKIKEDYKKYKDW